MSKTLFSSKCQVLGELWLYYKEDAVKNENWADFFRWADVALPLSYVVWQGIAVLSDEDNDGQRFINEAYDVFCQMIGIDKDIDYPTLGDAFGASPNPPIANE